MVKTLYELYWFSEVRNVLCFIAKVMLWMIMKKSNTSAKRRIEIFYDYWDVF